MPTPDVTLKDDYTVGSADIFLAITIGEGQHGTSSVLLGTTRIAAGSGSLRVKVGDGDDIKGKVVIVRSVVNDVISQTNRMSVTYRFTGGQGNGTFIARGVCPDDGGLLIFEATIDLK